MVRLRYFSFMFLNSGMKWVSKCLVGSIWKELVVVFEGLFSTAIVVSRFRCLAERDLCLGASCGWGLFGCDNGWYWLWLGFCFSMTRLVSWWREPPPLPNVFISYENVPMKGRVKVTCYFFYQIWAPKINWTVKLYV